jgi:hypothetical protein
VYLIKIDIVLSLRLLMIVKLKILMISMKNGYNIFNLLLIVDTTEEIQRDLSFEDVTGKLMDNKVWNR